MSCLDILLSICVVRHVRLACMVNQFTFSMSFSEDSVG